MRTPVGMIHPAANEDSLFVIHAATLRSYLHHTDWIAMKHGSRPSLSLPPTDLSTPEVLTRLRAAGVLVRARDHWTGYRVRTGLHVAVVQRDWSARLFDERGRELMIGRRRS